MEFTIDNVPMTAAPSRSRYPFKQLQIGQSFLVPRDQEKTLRAATAYFNSRNRDKKITCQYVDNGIRVGRIK